MTIQAQLADGRVLEFPDGTDPAVIQRTVKSQLDIPDEREAIPGVGGQARVAARRATQQRAEQTAAEREQFLAGLPPERRQLLESISPLEAGLIGAGRGFQTIGRGVGVLEAETPAEREQIEALRTVSPGAVGAGEILGETAPFLVPGLGVGGIAGTGARVAATAALGAAEGGIIARGQGRDIGDQLLSAGIGSTVAGALELGLPVLGRVGGALIRRILGRPPKGAVIDAQGNPSDELVQALDDSGLTLSDLTDDAINQLKTETLPPEQAARRAVLESEGLQPTTAQVTRDPADFQAQQEAAKTTGKVRQALEQQEATLTSRFDNAVLATGGEPVTPIASVVNAVTEKASVLDKEISRLYRQARESAPGAKNVSFNALAAKLKELSPSDRATGGAVRAVVGDLQAKGILDQNLKRVGRVTVEVAEDARKLMNELFDPQNPFRNGILRQLKDTLDDDVFRAAGRDVFKQGRAAKAAFEKELTRAKISKFDRRKANLVRDVLENKINPETLANDVVFSKRWQASDIKQLKDYISTDDVGKQAFDDLRAEVLESIKDRAFIGPVDQAGFQALSRAKLQTAIKSIGPEKLKVLFTADERRFLNNMLEVARIREPVRGTALGEGPTAVAVNKLRSRLREGGPITRAFGAIVDSIAQTRQGQAVLRGRPRVEREVGPSAQRQLAAQLGAVTAAQQEQQ